MLKPSVSKYVDFIATSPGKFKPIARFQIPENTVIEVCPVIPIPGRIAIALEKSTPNISSKLILDQLVIDREFEVFAKLGELELERRLDSGEINPDEYAEILRSKVNLNSLLNAQTSLIPLGNGLLYEVSESPNLIREYHEKDKVCVFKTIHLIDQGQELTYFK